MLLERMKRALVEKHGERIEELQRTVATQEAELEALQTQFSENVPPPEDWRPRQAVDDGDDQLQVGLAAQREQRAQAGERVGDHRAVLHGSTGRRVSSVGLEPSGVQQSIDESNSEGPTGWSGRMRSCR